jgi:hypothetical protein
LLEVGVSAALILLVVALIGWMLDLVGPPITPLAGELSPLGKKASWSRVPRLVGWPQLRRVRNVGEQGVCDRDGHTAEAVLRTSLGERVGARS